MKTGCWKSYRHACGSNIGSLKSWIRERKFEPGAKRKWESILGTYRRRWEEDNWKLQTQCFLNDEARQSLPNFLATVVLLPSLGVIYTHLQPNVSSGYQVQFHLEQCFSILATYELPEQLLKHIGAWAHLRLINSKSLQLEPRHFRYYENFSGDANVYLEWRTVGLKSETNYTG